MTPTLLFLGTYADKPYLQRLKGLVGTASVFLLTAPVSTVTEVVLYCKSRDITGVISTNTTLLKKLLGREHEVKFPSLDNYAGSYFKADGIEFVFINPLDQLISVPYGPFITRRFMSKLVEPKSWNPSTYFNWEILSPDNADRIYSMYLNADAIAVDIETFSSPPSIRCCGYTAIFISSNGIKTHSCVLPIDTQYNLSCMRKFNNLPAPKIFQNGKYDCAYLSRFDAVPHNYLWDTATLFHCWYSELPKDLAFLGSFFVREAMYWKDLAETTDLMEYYRYNALDTWTTANVWIEQMSQMPDYARSNYLQEFPLIFPCHLSEMIGVKRDPERMVMARNSVDDMIKIKSTSLDKMLSVSNFNVNSPIQMKAMLKILGCGDLESADEKNLRKAAFRHPMNGRIINTIVGLPGSKEVPDMGIRGLRKLKSTYLRTDADITKTSPRGSKEFHGRVLYSLNPHGTDTGRLASREHHFWRGLQIQNIPRGKEVKQTIVADNDFMFVECDLEQAESRDTAYISGDENLIAAVSGTSDFHATNASKFFGVPYNSIYDDATKKTLNKKLRDLAKRVNHGANYNMGPDVLVDTMGMEKILEAKKLLKLLQVWSPRQVAEYLLKQFHKTYPKIASVYYPTVIKDILTTKKLVGATGWTRFCFSDPTKSKSALNEYVAHCPQSLNAMVLNKAYLRVFYDIAINPKYSNNFKLCAQIHDSILFQIRIGHEYLIQMVKERMEIPVTIKGCDGVVRTFTVPAAIKAGTNGCGAKYWSDLE